MMRIKDQILEQILIVIPIYFIVFISQIIAKKTPSKELAFGLLISFIIVIPSIILKNIIKKPNLPGFAWSTLLAALLTSPISPISSFILNSVGNVDFMVTVTPLLAFAGISIGDKLPQLKKLSWKIAIIAIIVMCSTYFGSAFIAQMVLKFNNMI